MHIYFRTDKILHSINLKNYYAIKKTFIQLMTCFLLMNYIFFSKSFNKD